MGNHQCELVNQNKRWWRLLVSTQEGSPKKVILVVSFSLHLAIPGPLIWSFGGWPHSSSTSLIDCNSPTYKPTYLSFGGSFLYCLIIQWRLYSIVPPIITISAVTSAIYYIYIYISLSYPHLPHPLPSGVVKHGCPSNPQTTWASIFRKMIGPNRGSSSQLLWWPGGKSQYSPLCYFYVSYLWISMDSFLKYLMMVKKATSLRGPHRFHLHYSEKFWSISLKNKDQNRPTVVPWVEEQLMPKLPNDLIFNSTWNIKGSRDPSMWLPMLKQHNDEKTTCWEASFWPLKWLYDEVGQVAMLFQHVKANYEDF